MVQASGDLPKLVNALTYEFIDKLIVGGKWKGGERKGGRRNEKYQMDTKNENGEEIQLKVDLYGELLGDGQKIAMRYLSPGHYKTDKPSNNDENKKCFERKGVKFIDFPFYCTFTKEIISYYFLDTLFGGCEKDLKKAIASEKYKDAYRDCYKKHCDATPGWHGSSNKIHTFTNRGIDMFEQELNNFKSYQKNIKGCQNNIYNQIIHSIAVDYSIEGNLKDGINKSKNDKWINLVNSFKFNRQCAVCREFKKNFKHRIVRLRKKCGVVWWLSNFIASSKITKK